MDCASLAHGVDQKAYAVDLFLCHCLLSGDNTKYISIINKLELG